MTPWTPIALAGLAAVTGLMTAVWLLSLLKRDASIVDVFWGLGFVLLAWGWAVPAGVATVRRWLVPALVTVWGVRLAVHIFLRGRGQGEDWRYRAMRERWGAAFPWVSLAVVFWLQAVLLWIVAWPLLAAVTSPEPSGWTWLDTLACLLFAVGFAFEAVGDWQLARFKADPANRGRVMDRGLWRYTRHPNYFGDAVLWWGLACFAWATPGGWWTLAGPVLMTFLLLRVSGVTMLEKGMEEKRPAYREYKQRTRAFFPWFPRQPDDSP
jgi:steroid 5-alpha reductase family enzyme